MSDVTENHGLLVYRMKLMEAQIAAQGKELDEIKERNNLIDKERAAREAKFYWGAMTFLVGIITAMGGILWSVRMTWFGGQP